MLRRGTESEAGVAAWLPLAGVVLLPAVTPLPPPAPLLLRLTASEAVAPELQLLSPNWPLKRPQFCMSHTAEMLLLSVSDSPEAAALLV